MHKWIRFSFVLMFLLVLCPGTFAASDEELIRDAKLFWDKAYKMEQEFDPASADLYADSAFIQNTRRYPHGLVQEMTIEADKYKKLIRLSMGVAKIRGDTNQYSNFTYAVEKGRVRIKATRYSNMKKYESPLELLVGPDKKGQWLIYEEISESQP